MDGKLDFAIVMGASKEPKLIQIALTRTPFYILISSQDSLAKRYEVTLSELDKRRWILFEHHVNPMIYEHYDRGRRSWCEAGIGSACHEC